MGDVLRLGVSMAPSPVWVASTQQVSTSGVVLRHNKSAMRVKPTVIRFSHSEQRGVRPPRKEVRIKIVLRCSLTLGLLFHPLETWTQTGQRPSLGMAWRVSGAWHASGMKEPIVTGDAIVPGSLLQPAEEAHEQSITILLPDGQRVLYECFTAQDCARGFRVPSLYREPDLTAKDLLARVGAVLLRDDRPTKLHEEPHVPRDESVAVLGPENKVEIAGLAAALSNDTYWYEVRPLSGNSPIQARRAFDKRTRSITITLPAEGLFDVSIVDHSNTPRVDLMVVAFRQPRAAKVLKSFEVVQALLKEWNENYQGWPIHDFQRAYLRSAVLGIPPSPWRAKGKALTLKEIPRTDVTAEPKFSPKPGVFNGDTEVTLQCETNSATIHYTVDGSQPFAQSSTYHAPIMVKGTELTIKAFASANGKSDSPVVTGIFRIGD